MKRAALKYVAALALLVVAGLSCGEPSGPKAGELKVVLTTPSPGLDGAIMFTINGPTPLTSLTAEPGLRVFTDGIGGVTTRVILTSTTGALINAIILRVGVEDVGQVTQYTAAVNQVASNGYQLRVTGGYSLTVVK